MFAAGLLHIASIFVVAVTGAPVSVTGSSDCPTGAAVETALADLGVGPSSPLGGLHLEVGASDIWVTVTAADGRPLAAKQFSGTLTCSERAAAAAVFATTWDTAATLASPLAEVAVAPALPAADVTAAASPPAPVAAANVLRLGIGAMGFTGVAPSEGGPGYGFSLEAAFRPRPWWGMRADLFGMWPRTLLLAQGEATFRRLGSGVGTVMRKPWGWGAGQADLGLVLAHTTVTSDRPTATREASGWVPGVRLAGGVDVPVAEALKVGLELCALAWWRGEKVVDQDFGAVQRLPRIELLLRLSVNFEKSVPAS